MKKYCCKNICRKFSRTHFSIHHRMLHSCLVRTSQSGRRHSFACAFLTGHSRICIGYVKHVTFLEDIPFMQVLNFESDVCFTVGQGRLESFDAHNIQAVRIGLSAAISTQIAAYYEVYRWLRSPPRRFLSSDECYNTVVVELTIHSGTGTLKLMVRFIKDQVTQCHTISCFYCKT